MKPESTVHIYTKLSFLRLLSSMIFMNENDRFMLELCSGATQIYIVAV